MKLFREISKILCIDLGPQNSTEMVYDNITIICRPTWVRRVWFELLVTWLPQVFSLVVLSSWRFLYQMVSSERNFLQPVIKKESEPADWGATCMPPSQRDHEDQGKDTNGLASPCRHRFLLQTIMHATKIQSNCKCMGNFSPQCNCHWNNLPDKGLLENPSLVEMNISLLFPTPPHSGNTGQLLTVWGAKTGRMKSLSHSPIYVFAVSHRIF